MNLNISRLFTLITMLLIAIATCFCQTSSKPSVAIMKLQNYGIIDSEIDALTDRFRTEISNTRRFIVIERNQIERILKEHAFQMTGHVSTDRLIEAGRIIGVRYMMGGSVGKVGSTFTVNLANINVETGQVEKAVSRDYWGQVDDLLTTVIPGLARELVGEKGTSSESIFVKKDPNLAIILSFVLPGAGHFYCGNFGTGLAYFLTTSSLIVGGGVSAAYRNDSKVLWPALGIASVIHVFDVIYARKAAQKRNTRTSFGINMMPDNSLSVSFQLIHRF